jgi:hypothetical protein
LSRTPHCPHCGAILEKKGRSPKHHRFYFKAISCAFYHWPANARFVPVSEEHLRHWLQVEAQHFDLIQSDLKGDSEDVLRAAQFAHDCLKKARDTGSTGFVSASSKRLLARFPKSIAWDVVSEDEFQPIASKVFEIIQEITGSDVDTLVRETESAA